MDHFRLEGLRRAVREHLTEHGARNWKLVMDRFADVPRATFWRTIKAVRAEGEVLSKVKKQQPQDQAPAVTTTLFPADCQPLQKLAEYQGLIRSAQELIDQAKGPGGKIRNWQMHAKGVALRESLVRKQVGVMGELVDLDAQACLHQAVVDLVLEMAPELQKRFMLRLQELKDLSPEELREATRDVRPKPVKV